MKHPAQILLGIGCALTVLLSGCTATDDPPPGDPHDLADVSIADFGSVTAKLDLEHGTVALPLDPYNSRTPEIEALLVEAEISVQNQCLAQHGLGQVSGVPPAPEIDHNSTRRYVLWDLATAQRFGLGLDPTEKESYTDPSGDPQVIEACRSEGVTAILPLTGEGMGGTEESGPGIDIRIRDAAELLVEKDPGYAEAISEVDSCITDHGLRSDGHGHLGDGYAESPLDQQIPAAVTAVHCAIDDGAVQQIYDLQARYESAIMARYEGQLAAGQEKTETTVATLKKMIADAGAGHYQPVAP